MLNHFATFLFATVSAALLVPVCRAAAQRLNCVAQPAADRWHAQPTPLLGGVAIALPVIAGIAILGGLQEQIVLVTCASLIAVVGLTDDIISLKPATKLVAEIVLASVFLFLGYRLHWLESMVLDSLLTVLWVVGITNAFNLLDHMDGLCGGVALIAGAAFLAAGPLAQPGDMAFFETRYLTLLLGAVAGFLFHNVYPASIFMGDAGSLFLGMSLAGLTLGQGAKRVDEASLLSIVAAPMLVLLIPILDTTLVTACRLLSGRSAAAGGRDHSSHRLVAIGLSERRAVAVLWTLAALAGASGMVTQSLELSWSILLVAMLLLAMTVFTVYLANVRVYDEADVTLLRRRGRLTPLSSTFPYQRRAADVLLDFYLVSIAYYAAYRLRFEGVQFPQNFPYFIGSLPIVIASQMIALFAMGAYRGVWRHFSLMDVVVFGKSVLLGTAVAQLVILYLYRFESYSITVFIIYAPLLFLLVAGSRASFRLIGELASRRRQVGERLVIYGAGAAGAVAVREVTTNPEALYRLVGFIDDDPGTRGIRVHGYPVLGPYATLESMLALDQIDTVLISIREIEQHRLASIETLTAKHDVKLMRLHLSIEDLGGTRPRSIRSPRRQASSSQ